MSRPLSQTFRCQPLAELARQLLFAPPVRRIEQIRRTETLHDDIEPLLNYPLDFVWYRITGYRGESVPTTVLTGQAILSDLRLIIDQLSQSVTIPVTEDDPAIFPDELAEKLGVSTKTISRWRSLGLRWRWVIQPGHQRPTIAYPVDSVERFMANYPNRVRRASKFTHVDPEDRVEIINDARQMAESTSLSLNGVAENLAKKMGRAHQTIRHILEEHERNHPNDRVFINRTPPLTVHQKRWIIRSYRNGVPVNELAQQFKRTSSTMYRVIRRRRAEAIQRLPITFYSLQAFEAEHAEEDFTKIIPEPPKPRSKSREPHPLDRMLPQSLHAFYSGPVADTFTFKGLLTQYNYLKFATAKARLQLSRHDPRANDIKRIEQYIQQASQCRARIIKHSLPIVLSLAHRHLMNQPDKTLDHLIQLLEAAMPVLVEVIDRYDITRKQEFSASLKWSLMRCFAQIHPATLHTRRARRRLDASGAIDRIRQTAVNHRIKWPNEISELEHT